MCPQSSKRYNYKLTLVLQKKCSMAATRGDEKNVMAGIYNMKLRNWSCDFLTPFT